MECSLPSAKCPRPPGRWENFRTKDGLGEPFKEPIIPFEAMVEYYPDFTERSFQEFINLARKYHLESFLAML